MNASRDEAVEILCDGGSHGLGHLRRSEALAAALESRGRRVRVSALSEEGRRLLVPRPGFDGRASVCVFDLPYEIADLVAQCRSAGAATLALDYFGEAAPDLTISVLERRSPPPAGRRLSGFEYAIVRADVAARAPAPEGAGVLVLFGGGDALKRGAAVASRLHALGERVTLVSGPLAPDPGSLPGVEALRAPADLPDRLAACGWAATNGGVTMTELMCLGKAVHVVPQTEDEDRFARRLLALDALLGVGEDSLAVPDAARRREVGSAARRVVDGRGAERIADAIGRLS